MQKENYVKVYEKYLKNIDASLKEIYRKLYNMDIQSDELGNISVKLNELLKENEQLKRVVTNDITKTLKHSHKLYLAYTGIALLTIGSCFISYGLAIPLIVAEVGMIVKNIGNTTLTDLESIKENADFQNYRIVRYKKTAAGRIKIKSKEYDDSEVYGMNFNDAYEIALECVRTLLDGGKTTIENDLVKDIVKELLKDENYPDATIEELVELKRSKMSKGMVLEKSLD